MKAYFWLVALVIAVAMLHAGARGQDRPPRFRTAISVVEVDATAVNEAGQPVRGLTAPDFTVRENGQQRRIVAVREITISDGPQPHDTSRQSQIHDVADNQFPEGRLLVLFIDDATLLPDAAIVHAAREIASGAIERMGTADLMSVVFTGNNSHAQDFTRDRARLRRAIERTSVGFDVTQRGTQRLWQASVRTLLNIAEALRGVPRHRKAIIYVSIGVPGGAPRFLEQWRALTHATLASSTPIYAFDPSGVGGIEMFNAAHPYSRVSGPPSAFRNFLGDISAGTGGRAALVTNDYGPALSRLFEDTASYYLIGYETPLPVDDGRFRRLEVHATRPGTRVHARSGFYAHRAPSRASAGSRPFGGAHQAIGSPIPGGDLAIRAMAAPFAGPSHEQATVAVVVALRHPVAGVRHHTIEVITGAFEQDGRQRALQRQVATARLADHGSADAVYEVSTSVSLKPGRYRLRIGAHNQTIDKSGSVFLDVDVPDFSRERLSLSGLIVGASGGPKNVSVGSLRSLLPVMPSTLREFSRSDSVTAFLRVYHSPEADPRQVLVSVRVLDVNGTVVEQSNRSLLPEDFSTRSADVSLTVPVDRLPVGSYTLQLQASSPALAVATRELAFTISPTRP